MAFSRITPLLLVILLSLSFSSLVLVSSSGDHNLFHEVCNHTLQYDLCVSSFESSPISKSADLKTLATIALKLALANATDTSSHIAQLLNDNNDPFLQQCLSQCSEQYSDVIEQIHDSLLALDDKSYADVNTWVTAVMTDIQVCEDGFNDKPGYTSPLSKRNADFYMLCANSLAITNLLS